MCVVSVLVRILMWSGLFVFSLSRILLFRLVFGLWEFMRA